MSDGDTIFSTLSSRYLHYRDTVLCAQNYKQLNSTFTGQAHRIMHHLLCCDLYLLRVYFISAPCRQAKQAIRYILKAMAIFGSTFRISSVTILQPALLAQCWLARCPSGWNEIQSTTELLARARFGHRILRGYRMPMVVTRLIPEFVIRRLPRSAIEQGAWHLKTAACGLRLYESVCVHGVLSYLFHRCLSTVRIDPQTWSKAHQAVLAKECNGRGGRCWFTWFSAESRPIMVNKSDWWDVIFQNKHAGTIRFFATEVLGVGIDNGIIGEGEKTKEFKWFLNWVLKLKDMFFVSYIKSFIWLAVLRSSYKSNDKHKRSNNSHSQYALLTLHSF